MSVVGITDRGPSLQYTFPIAGPPEASEFGIGVQMRGLPADGFFAFAVPGYDAASSVIFPPPPNTRSEIWAPNLSVLVTVGWRGGYASSMTLSYWQGPTVPPPGAAIVPIVGIPALTGVEVATFPSSSFDIPAHPERVRLTEVAALTF